MHWIILILAGLMEVGFTFCLGKTKTATGQEQIWWWGGFLAALSLSIYLMAKAAERLPIGTVYPVWNGIGAIGAVIVGIQGCNFSGFCLKNVMHRENPLTRKIR